MSDLIEQLRGRTMAKHGGPSRPLDGWNLSELDSELHVQAATEIEALRTSLAHWKVFGEHAEGERSRLRGEQSVLVRLLLDAGKVVSTVEGECQEELDQLADLRRAIAAATIPHRPEDADLLSLRACIGA